MKNNLIPIFMFNRAVFVFRSLLITTLLWAAPLLAANPPGAAEPTGAALTPSTDVQYRSRTGMSLFSVKNIKAKYHNWKVKKNLLQEKLKVTQDPAEAAALAKKEYDRQKIEAEEKEKIFQPEIGKSGEELAAIQRQNRHLKRKDTAAFDVARKANIERLAQEVQNQERNALKEANAATDVETALRRHQEALLHGVNRRALRESPNVEDSLLKYQLEASLKQQDKVDLDKKVRDEALTHFNRLKKARSEELKKESGATTEAEVTYAEEQLALAEAKYKKSSEAAQDYYGASKIQLSRNEIQSAVDKNKSRLTPSDRAAGAATVEPSDEADTRVADSSATSTSLEHPPAATVATAPAAAAAHVIATPVTDHHSITALTTVPTQVAITANTTATATRKKAQKKALKSARESTTEEDRINTGESTRESGTTTTQTEPVSPPTASDQKLTTSLREHLPRPIGAAVSLATETAPAATESSLTPIAGTRKTNSDASTMTEEMNDNSKEREQPHSLRVQATMGTQTAEELNSPEDEGESRTGRGYHFTSSTAGDPLLSKERDRPLVDESGESDEEPESGHYLNAENPYWNEKRKESLAGVRQNIREIRRRRSIQLPDNSSSTGDESDSYVRPDSGSISEAKPRQAATWHSLAAQQEYLQTPTDQLSKLHQRQRRQTSFARSTTGSTPTDVSDSNLSSVTYGTELGDDSSGDNAGAGTMNRTPRAVKNGPTRRTSSTNGNNNNYYGAYSGISGIPNDARDDRIAAGIRAKEAQREFLRRKSLRLRLQRLKKSSDQTTTGETTSRGSNNPDFEEMNSH